MKKRFLLETLLFFFWFLWGYAQQNTPVSLPYVTGFEDSDMNVWQVYNGEGSANRWVIGQAVNHGGMKSLYITNDTVNKPHAYDMENFAVSIAYLDIQFGNATSYEVSFDWVGQGEHNYDVGWIGIQDPDDDFPSFFNVNRLPQNMLPFPDESNVLTVEDYLYDGTWKTVRFSIDSNNVANRVKRIFFMWSNDMGGGSNPPIAIDNFSIKAVSCHAIASEKILIGLQLPTLSVNFADDAIPNAARLTLSSNHNVDTQLVAYNFPCLLNVRSQTNYTLSVEKICGAGDTSVAAIKTFRTPCLPEEIPFVEDFNEDGFIYNSCWSKKKRLFTDTVDMAGAYSGNWMQSGGYTFEGMSDAHMYLRLNGEYSALNEWLISPSIDLGQGSEPRQVVFDLMVTGSSSETVPPPAGSMDNIRFAVAVSKNGGNTWLKSQAYIWDNSGLAYGNITTFNDNVQRIVIPLTDENSLPLTGHASIAFYAEVPLGNANTNFLRIDNFSVEPYELCPLPRSFKVDSIRANEAHLTIQPITGTNAWEYEIQEVNDEFQETFVTMDTNTVLLSGLFSSTTYKIRVRTSCQNGEVSDWSDSICFRTNPDPIAVPTMMDFEDAHAVYEIGFFSEGKNHWIIDTATARSGNYSLYIASEDSLKQNFYDNRSSSVSLAFIDLLVDNGATYELSFDWKGMGQTDETMYGGATPRDFMKVFFQDVTDPLPKRQNAAAALTFAGKTTLNRSAQWTNAYTEIQNIVAENGVKRLIFAWFNDGSAGIQPPAAVDNISFSRLLCPAVKNLHVDSITTERAILAWHNIGAESYELKCGTVMQGDTTYIVNEIVYDTSYILSTLVPSTEYFVSVVSMCSQGNGRMSDVLRFRTKALPIHVPYTCDFEPTANVSPWMFYTEDGTDAWIIDSAVAKDGNFSLYVTNNGHDYAYDDNSLTYAYADVVFSSAAEHVLSFDWKCKGETRWDFLKVLMQDVSDPLPFSVSPDEAAIVYNGSKRFLSGDTNWHHVSVNLDTSVANQTKRIIFVWKSDGSNHGSEPAAVDNFSLIPSGCPVATIQTHHVTHESATVYIDASASEFGWVIDVAVNDSLIMQEHSDSTLYTIFGLEPSTRYTVSVRTLCSESDTSDISNVIDITTDCEPASLPYFDAFAEVPACWQRREARYHDSIRIAEMEETRRAEGWQHKTVDGHDHVTGNIYGTNKYYWLVSPTFRMEQNENNELIFNMWITSFDGFDSPSYIGSDKKFMVLVSTDAGYTWNADNTVVWDMDSTHTDVYRLNTISNVPSSYHIPLGDYSGLVKVAFYIESVVSGGDDIEWHIDSIFVGVKESPTCLTPTDVVISDTAETSVTVTWTENGTAASWSIDYNGMEVTANTNPYLLTGLTANTEYVVKVRAVCGDEAESEWSDIVMFTTKREPQTCIAPTNITFSDVSSTTASVSWIENGTATSWTIDYNGTEVTASTNPYLLTGLMASTEYTVRVKAVCSVDNESEWSNAITFTTKTPTIISFVVTEEASAVTNSTALLKASVSCGNDGLTEVGFEWKKEQSIAYSPVSVAISPTDTTFEYELTGLSPNTSYVYRAYIVTDGEQRYGEEKTFVTDNVGMEDLEGKTDVHIFPNPAKDEVTMEIRNAKGYIEWMLIDMDGRIVESGNIPVGEEQKVTVIEVSHLPKGIYYLQVQEETKVFTRKLIVQ